MKAVLKFNLTDPEEVQAFERAVAATNMASALFEIFYNLRRKVEDGIDNSKKDMEPHDVVDKIFTEINDILYSHNVIVDKLIS